ncbi:hypothetical protein [Nitrosomonas sp. Is79A3]|uniref:hypothetical protein n=1 Tax=Nitrosomonas sp. (strain Is79A3) TaxID=261292 RepID=UPI0018DC7990
MIAEKPAMTQQNTSKLIAYFFCIKSGMMLFTNCHLIPITDKNSNNIAFIFGRGHHGTEGKWDGAT